MYKYVLLPGRHHAVTNFQVEHLKHILSDENVAKDADVIWAITSANHSGTRHNPISGSRRLGMVEAIAAKENLPSQTFRIIARSKLDNFAHYLLEDIRVQSHGHVDMTPENTLLICSTENVANQYKEMGFSVNTAESSKDFSEKHHKLPWDIVEEIISSGSNWQRNPLVIQDLHPECLHQYVHYGLADEIIEIFEDPLITNEDGDITQTRDYDKYRQAFEDGAARKLVDFKEYIKPGKILDVGCATGETIKLMSEIPELFESDFYGVEAARHLYSICRQRKDRGDFGDADTFFYQCNIMRDELFPKDYFDTVITMALTHEVESYLGHQALRDFLERMYEILKPGGVYINYDVVAPDDKEKIVYVQFTDGDGENPDDIFPNISGREQVEFLRSLSSKNKFLRFSKDFRREEGDGISYEARLIDGQEYYMMKYADLCEFLAKKDYNESWHSEMHEKFCFWEYKDWVKALKDVGFEIGEGSEPKQNTWLIENRFAPAADVFEHVNGQLKPMGQPITNTLLVAVKD